MQQEPDLSEGDVNRGPLRDRWLAGLDQDTRSILEEDARWFFHQSLSTPCLDAISSAHGACLTTHAGRQFLDFHGNGLHQAGYGHPKVIAAIKSTLDALPFCPRRYTNTFAIELARRLCEAAPIPDARVLFAPAGTLATGMALKLARIVTGRFKTLSMWDSFHGASLDAISVGGEAIFRRGLGPLLPGTEHVPACNPGNCVFGCGGHCTLRCVDYIDHCLSREGDVAAVIVETVRSTDVRFPPVEYYARLRQICDHHGTLLILDEIPLAFGRTGPMFAIEHYGIEPDMILVGKGLGGGTMPLAALIARGDYNVAAETALGHYTHEKSPVACAAGLALLEAIEEENLLERSQVLGQHAIDLLRRNTATFDPVTEIRGAGLLIGVELSHPDLAEKVLYRCLANGLSFKVGQGRVLVLAPPLTIGEQELELAIDIVTEAIAFGEES